MNRLFPACKTTTLVPLGEALLLFLVTFLSPLRAETPPEQKEKALKQTPAKSWIAAYSSPRSAHMNIKSSDSKVQSICANLVGRERTLSEAPHAKWLATADAQLEITYLTEHYDQLSDDMRKHVPVSLAQTGAMSAVPLILKALADTQTNKEVLFRLGLVGRIPAGEFGQRIAPALLPLADSSFDAVDLMFKLDQKFALQSLSVGKFLTPDSLIAPWIVRNATAAGAKIPRHLLDPLVAGWRNTPNLQSCFPHKEGVQALELYGIGEALKESEAIVQIHPHLSDEYAEYVLKAAGLSGLFEGLVEHSFDLKKWGALPDQAKIYYAVKNLELYLINESFDCRLPLAYAGDRDEGNPQGDMVPWLRKGYLAIGDTMSTQWLDWMLKPFGPNGPAADGSERIKQMERMQPEYSEQFEALEESWHVHREATFAKPYPPGGDWLLSKYAVKHADVLRPFVKK